MRLAELMWDAMKVLIPEKKSKVGRPEHNPEKTFAAIIFIIKTGCHWSLLPEKYGNYKTIHGKFMKWCRLGLFDQLFERIGAVYQEKNAENNWYAVDTSSKKAPFAKNSGKNPTDRAKRGIKHIIMVDRKGAPILADIAPANRHDSQLVESLVAKMKPSKSIRIIAADSAFDVRRLYKACKDKNIALIASTNPRRDRLKHRFHAPYRWIVEQIFGILSWFRGIKNCWNKSYEANLAFLKIACSQRLLVML